MERFKAVEKEMKTKAYSKEGLLASTKLDPKEKEKAELREFLSECVSKLEQQIEMCEAESESIMATFRKGKKDSHKTDRVAEIERQVERHKWHIQKLELIMRLLENGNLEVEPVSALREDIKYYVDSNQDPDFAEDESIYDELNLDEEGAEEAFGIGFDDKLSSQDAASTQDDLSEVRPKGDLTSNPVAQRRPSTQLKSPMPAPATLHTPSTPATSNATLATPNGKPAPAPATPAGQPLKYASAAAAAAGIDRNGVGILPLPPPPGIPTNANGMSNSSLPPANAPKEPSQKNTPLTQAAVPDMSAHRSASSSLPPTPVLDKVDKLASTHTSTPSPRSQAAVPASIPEQPTQAQPSSKPSTKPSTPAPPPGLSSVSFWAFRVSSLRTNIAYRRELLHPLTFLTLTPCNKYRISPD
jgi:CCR4-NOT transcription complex subunit 3